MKKQSTRLCKPKHFVAAVLFTLAFLVSMAAPVLSPSYVYAQEPPAGPADDTASTDGVADSLVDKAKCEPGALFSILGVEVPNPLGWFVCAVAGMVTSSLSTFTDAIQALFYFAPQEDSDSPDVVLLKGVWGSVLNIANLIVVIGLLIIIISQALDFGIFSNYTIKKMVPRLLLGVVLANLSWEFTSIIIHLFNLTGNLIGGLFLGPLIGHEIGTGKDAVEIVMSDGMRNIITLVVGGLMVAIYASGGTVLVAVIPILIAGLVAALIAFLTLIIRRIIIIVLIVLAPLACAAWALPGGDKWFGKWWKLFLEMMIMYPMIELFFASGLFVAILSGGAVGGSDAKAAAIGAVIGLIAILIPYAMLPVAFKMSSGVLGGLQGQLSSKIGGGAKDWSKGRMGRSYLGDKKAEQQENRDAKQKRKNYGRLADRLGSAASYERSGSRWKRAADRARFKGTRAKIAQHSLGGKDQWEEGLNVLKAKDTKANMRAPIAEAEVQKLQAQSAELNLQKLMLKADSGSQMTGIARGEFEKGSAGLLNAKTDIEVAENTAKMAAALDQMVMLKDDTGLADAKNTMLANGQGNVWQNSVNRNYDGMQSINPYFTKDGPDAVNAMGDASLGAVREPGWKEHFNRSAASGSLDQTIDRLIQVANNPNVTGLSNNVRELVVVDKTTNLVDKNATKTKVQGFM